MAWRDSLARSLGREVDPKTNPRTLMDRMDYMDRIPSESISVHTVHFVHSPSTLEKREAQAASLPPGLFPHGGAVPLLTSAQCREVRSWPVATQRVFLAALERFEGQGYGLPEAEALSRQTVFGSPPSFPLEPPLPPLPVHLEPEARAMAARLEAAGWRGGYSIAHAILSDRHGLAAPAGQEPSPRACPWR